MTLSDVDIAMAMANGSIKIESPTSVWKWKIQPASVDFNLGAQWLRYLEEDRGSAIDVAQMVQMERVNADTYELPPGGFVLGATDEVLTLDNKIAARIEGKSSLGRLGLVVHVTAGFIDPGFSGRLTLEFFNASPRPILLRAGMPVCQVSFMRLDTPAAVPYTGKYQGATGPQISRYWLNFREGDTCLG